MGKPLSMDLRTRVIAAIDEGLSRRKAAARFGVAPSTAVRWDTERRRTGTFAPKPQGGDTRSRKIEAHAGLIHSALEETPDLTLAEMCGHLALHGVASSTSSLSRFFQRHGVSLKKRPAMRSSRTAPDVLKRRHDWFDGQFDLDPDKLVFIDETWTATNMTRSHGRCRRGERLRMGYPHGHRKTTTLVAGLRRSGMVAPMVLDGPINGDWFETYVERLLIPTLKPGDTVIMDNLSSHKRKSVREKIEAVGAKLLFLPPYSPDFNPIEMAFSKLKALLRKAGERTIEALWSTIGKLVGMFQPNECANYFAACGYDAD